MNQKRNGVIETHRILKIKALKILRPKCISHRKGQKIKAYHMNGVKIGTKIKSEEKFQNTRLTALISSVKENKAKTKK